MSFTTAHPIGRQVHSFEMYPTTPISRSKFDRSHSFSCTMDAGYIVPIWYDEAVPGDTLIVSCSTLSRLATQIVPFMDNVYMDVHFWAVPYRLVWSHWKNFNGEQSNKYDPTDPLGDTDYLTPQLNSGETGVSVGSIYDYFGIPIGVANLNFNSFLFRSYNLTWNEFYRDENLQDPVTVRVGDNGVDELTDFTLLKRGKRKDYFTSCLPFPQKGPAVDLPLGHSAPIVSSTGNATVPVIGTGASVRFRGYAPDGESANRYAVLAENSDDSLQAYYKVSDSAISAGQQVTIGTTVNTGNSFHDYKAIGFDNNINNPFMRLAPGAYADLSNATAATINTLRQAFAVQRVFEKDARGGSRYIEMILSHFGVKSPDERLQRPEFLGGGTFNLNLNVVPQTSSTSVTSPQGNLSSYGVINGHTQKIVHSFTEHCLVFAVASIRADLSYQQGLHRNYSRRSRFDYYLPSLANLGEQAVLNKEIFAQGASVLEDDNETIIDDEVFGYQERWAEMRTKSNRIAGLLRSDASASLDIWHLSQDFSSLPKLNSDFIEENPPIDRVIAVTGDNTAQFICNFWFDEQWVRPMPVYSIPSMSSHF